MIVMLPKDGGLSKLEASLTDSSVEQMLQTASLEEVDISLPKFKGISKFELPTPLSRMGMTDAFSEMQADFSGITLGNSFFIEDIIHQACVEVGEEGTEASAATAVFFADSMPRVFNANHPFLFLIKDHSTGAIMFMGRITNPLKG
jgi:serpin B